MEFREKLLDLRKQKKLTQEQLAETIHISRAAVSKWESGRGFPNLDALKNLSRVFGVSIDELLSSDELIRAAEDDQRTLKRRMGVLVFGILDSLAVTSFFLPFWGEREGTYIRAVDWFHWTQGDWNRTVYGVLFVVMGVWGLVEIGLQFWDSSKKTFASAVSLVLHILMVVLFTAAREPYLGTAFFLLLVAKVAVMLRTR